MNDLEKLLLLLNVLKVNEFDELIRNVKGNSDLQQDQKMQWIDSLNLFVIKKNQKNTSLKHNLKPLIDFPTVQIIYENLLTISAIEKSFEGYNMLQYKTRRLLLLVPILISRSGHSLAESLLENILKTCKENEFYSEHVEALQIYRHQLAVKKDSKKFNKSKTNFEKVTLSRNLKEKTRDIHINFLFTDDINLSLEYKKIKKDLDFIENAGVTIGSKSIQAYHLLISIDYFEKQKMFDKKYKSTLLLIKLLEDNPFLKTNSRLIILKVMLADVDIDRFQFKIAANRIDEVLLPEFKANFLMTKIAHLMKLKLSILLGEPYGTIEHVTNNKLVEKLKLQVFLEAKMLYFLSVANFLLSKHKLAIEMLSGLTNLQKDKEGWNIWIRYMKILCRMELKKYDEADKAIERFRKYTQRHQNVTPRIKLVVKVFVDLAQKGFDFNVTATRKAKEIQLLKSVQEDVRWLPSSPELILFHDWFEAKLLNRDYVPNYETYKEEGG